MALKGSNQVSVRRENRMRTTITEKATETGLSFMQATDIPTWAALSTSGLQALILPRGVREIVIAADPDEQGLKAAREAAMRWWEEGRKVRIAKPPTGLDFNDLARTS